MVADVVDGVLTSGRPAMVNHVRSEGALDLGDALQLKLLMPKMPWSYCASSDRDRESNVEGKIGERSPKNAEYGVERSLPGFTHL